MKITVCIASYNRALYLSEAIESVLNQTYPVYELVIYDNGSEDDVYKSVSKYLTDKVKWVGSIKNNSAIWNFRRAIEKTETDYIMILHDDDKLCSDFIEKQLDFLQKNPDVGAVSCNGYIINEKSTRTGRFVRNGFINRDAEIYNKSLDVAAIYASDGCIPFSPMVYKTKFIKKIDFRDEYSKVCDAVLFCDLADVGKIAYQSLVLYECRVHSSQDSSVFSEEILNQLETFFLTRKSEKASDLIHLKNLLVKQKTNRILHHVFNQKFKLINLRLLKSKDFNLNEAIKILLATIFKKGKRILSISTPSN